MERGWRDLEPTARGLGPHVRRLVTSRCALAFILLWASLGGQRSAAADPSSDPLPTAKNLDGLYVALGPVAAAAYTEDAWDGAFGGEIMLVRVRERATLAGFGVAAGAVRFAQAGNGRVWGDLLVGTKKLFGVGLGLSAGLAVEVGDVQPAHFGWQATVWGYAGVIPYVRVGQLETTGAFVDAGIKIALPALRWR